MMRVLRVMLASLLLIMLLPVLLAQAALSTGRATLGSPEFVRAQLVAGEWAQMLPRTLADQLHRQLSDAGGPMALTQEEWFELAVRVLPAQQVWNLTDAVITGAYDWLNGRTPVPQIVLDLSSIKQELPAAARAALLGQVQKLPPCSPQQLAAMAASPPQGLPSCRPADGALLAAMMDRYPLERALADIPDRLDIAAAVAAAQGPQIWQRFQPVPIQFRRARVLGLWGWVAAVLGLGLLALITYRRWYSPLGWCGTALMLAGAVLVLGAALLVPALMSGSSWISLQQVPAVLMPSVRALASGVAENLMLHGAILSALGLALIVTTMFGAMFGARSHRPPVPGAAGDDLPRARARPG